MFSILSLRPCLTPPNEIRESPVAPPPHSAAPVYVVAPFCSRGRLQDTDVDEDEEDDEEGRGGRQEWSAPLEPHIKLQVMSMKVSGVPELRRHLVVTSVQRLETRVHLQEVKELESERPDSSALESVSSPLGSEETLKT
ncbi:unnamed protein product [Pleuronectes platessa]|uniref:Uncharacterized protein n=1 Tax=Pleuronectes platessa TaxID=8262 RepID=A0A9N7TWT8_PLEPL|nr:unnamed protein product [Pleuronectes platessa]